LTGFDAIITAFGFRCPSSPLARDLRRSVSPVAWLLRQRVDLDWHKLVAGWDGSLGRGYALDLDGAEAWLRGGRT
jgi:hypothetical protein